MTTSVSQPWILASASPRRREILGSLGLRFIVDPTRAPEPTCRRGESPRAFADRAARVKATEIARRHTQGRIIAADTIVVVGGEILGKPRGEDEAREMIIKLQGRWHEVVTGLCLYDCSRRRLRQAHTISRVHFRRMPSKEITEYLSTGEFADKAGAYAIQGRASLFIDRIEGCYFNIVGFPVSTFERLCRSMGWPLLGEILSRKAATKSTSKAPRREEF